MSGTQNKKGDGMEKRRIINPEIQKMIKELEKAILKGIKK